MKEKKEKILELMKDDDYVPMKARDCHDYEST